MKNIIKPLALSIGTFVFAGLSHAADVHEGISPYVGGSYGRVDMNNDDFGDDEDSTYSIYSGLKVGPVFAAQVAYVDFGGTENDLFSTNTKGIELSGLAYLLDTEFVDFYLRGGVLFWDAELNNEAFSIDNDGSELFWGLGSDLNLTENVSIRIEYARYNVEYEDDEFGPLANGAEYNLNHLNAGVNFRF